MLPKSLGPVPVNLSPGSEAKANSANSYDSKTPSLLSPLVQVLLQATVSTPVMNKSSPFLGGTLRSLPCLGEIFVNVQSNHKAPQTHPGGGAPGAAGFLGCATKL